MQLTSVKEIANHVSAIKVHSWVTEKLPTRTVDFMFVEKILTEITKAK